MLRISVNFITCDKSPMGDEGRSIGLQIAPQALETKKRIRMHKIRKMLVELCILLCALLPFLHDIITDAGGNAKDWVPDLGIERYLTNPETGKVLGYSAYRVMLAIVGMQLFALIGWVIALNAAKGRPWRWVLLFPVSIMTYQVTLVVLDLKETSLNDWNYKILILIIVGIILIINFFKRGKFSKRKEKNEH